MRPTTPGTLLKALPSFRLVLGLIEAASTLRKGSSQEVDGQKLTASPGTDKSRFLTFCYALETFLDGRANLMQASNFQRRSRPKKTGS
jgi:hypothetical protein